MADYVDGDTAELVVFGIGEGLGRGDDNAFAGVDSQRVKVFHVADGDAIIRRIPHHFILDFFPAAQPFFHENLSAVSGHFGEGPVAAAAQFRLVTAEA